MQKTLYDYNRVSHFTELVGRRRLTESSRKTLVDQFKQINPVFDRLLEEHYPTRQNIMSFSKTLDTLIYLNMVGNGSFGKKPIAIDLNSLSCTGGATIWKDLFEKTLVELDWIESVCAVAKEE